MPCPMWDASNSIIFPLQQLSERKYSLVKGNYTAATQGNLMLRKGASWPHRDFVLESEYFIANPGPRATLKKGVILNYVSATFSLGNNTIWSNRNINLILHVYVHVD